MAIAIRERVMMLNYAKQVVVGVSVCVRVCVLHVHTFGVRLMEIMAPAFAAPWNLAMEGDGLCCWCAKPDKVLEYQIICDCYSHLIVSHTCMHAVRAPR